LRCNHAPLRIPAWRLGVHPLRRLCNKLIPTPQPRIWVVQATPPPTLPPWIQPHPHCSIHLCVVSGTVHCVHKTVNFVSGTVNYMSRTLQCVCGTGNFVHIRDEHMYLPANVLSTLESCVSSFSKLQSVPVLSGSGYIFATNFTAWFYHEFFVCSRKYFYCAKFPIDIKTIPLHFKQTAPSSVIRACFYQRTTVEMFFPPPASIRGINQFCGFSLDFVVIP